MDTSRSFLSSSRCEGPSACGDGATRRGHGASSRIHVSTSRCEVATCRCDGSSSRNEKTSPRFDIPTSRGLFTGAKSRIATRALLEPSRVRTTYPGRSSRLPRGHPRVWQQLRHRRRSDAVRGVVYGMPRADERQGNLHHGQLRSLVRQRAYGMRERVLDDGRRPEQLRSVRAELLRRQVPERLVSTVRAGAAANDEQRHQHRERRQESGVARRSQ